MANDDRHKLRDLALSKARLHYVTSDVASDVAVSIFNAAVEIAAKNQLRLRPSYRPAATAYAVKVGFKFSSMQRNVYIINAAATDSITSILDVATGIATKYGFKLKYSSAIGPYSANIGFRFSIPYDNLSKPVPFNSIKRIDDAFRDVFGDLYRSLSQSADEASPNKGIQ